MKFITTFFILTYSAASLNASTRSHSSSSNGIDDKIIILLVVVAIAFVVMIISAISQAINKPTAKQLAKRNESIENEAKEVFALVASGRLPEVETSVILDADEKAFLEEPVSLIEEKSSRVFGGVGTSIKGIHFGGGGSTSVQGLSRIDSGKLTLTTKKIVFTGSMEGRVIEIKKNCVR